MDEISRWAERTMRGRPVPEDLILLARIQADRSPDADFESDPLHAMEVTVLTPDHAAQIPPEAAAHPHFAPILTLPNGHTLGYWLPPTATPPPTPQIAALTDTGTLYTPPRGTTLTESLAIELTPHPAAFRHLARRLSTSGLPLTAHHPSQLPTPHPNPHPKAA
ncbi:hypothetical protein [Actinocorallia sp. A-T 12471]|uniref:hypothetical protein n=1 Tax=Actinocorallia sp. A-T 12471 TaxID=3089813 RepID=UPI0029CEAD2D|nr:hypothetical protein [Actinocorallia sp. A-T 12471]MDX6744436.1 hypothetical protein [Actinocorallia sp. A-T 12471]